MKWSLIFLALLSLACNRSSASNGDSNQSGAGARAPQVEVVRVVSQKLSTSDSLPGELTAYQTVAIYPRVKGFIEEIPVDRGSVMRRGELIARLSAPELAAQRAEAEAKMSGDKATYEGLKLAASTPGAVAKNELHLAQDALKADLERVRSLRTLESYLIVTAPFDGVITERDVHTGALVGPPSSSASPPIVRIEENDHLRLTVPVPEPDAGGIARGAKAEFAVSTWPGRTFVGTISRVSEALDERTRTMPVEMDVDNRDAKLAPGMFAEVRWPVRRDIPTLFVPAAAVVESMESMFIQVVRNDRVQKVAVKRGKMEGNLVEVFGAVRAGEFALARGSEEIADGTTVVPKVSEAAATSAQSRSTIVQPSHQ